MEQNDSSGRDQSVFQTLGKMNLLFRMVFVHLTESINTCVQPSTVRLGDTDLSSSQNDFDAQQINIKRIKRHPLHRFAQSYHDIALIELEMAVRLNQAVCPACLWLEEYIPEEQLRIVGFGEQQHGGGLSSTLQQGRVSFLSTEACEERFAGDRRVSKGLKDSQFCASHDSMDTCQGDSGGPIEVRRVDMDDLEHPLVVGVTSFGTPCVNGSTGVYTKIASYIDWIESETNERFSYDSCTTRCTMRRSGSNFLASTAYNAIVHLLYENTTESRFNCTGTLIDDRFILTSAFCATSSSTTPKFVYVSQNEEMVPIDDIFVHPLYTFGNPTNDIALLKLSLYLKPNSGLKPTCLWNKEATENELISFIMHSVNTSSKDQPKFKYYTKSFELRDHDCKDDVKTNEICAANSFPVIPGICNLDAGGPILKKWIPTISALYGVTAVQSTGCDQQLHGTAVEPHTEWIESIIFRMQRQEVLIVA